LARVKGQLDDPAPGGVMRRVQHPVHWGCIKAAQLSVSNTTFLPARNAPYETDIRISKQAFDPDSEPKFFSIALKIRGVTGPRVDSTGEYQPAENKDTQDIILVSTDILPLVAEPEELITIHQWMMSYGALPGAVGFLAVRRPTLLL